MSKTIAVFGTGSDVGKSVVNTAICRFLAEQGWDVAPFKAQNMSNNSGVTPEGLEMGRAQIVQAEACGISPHVDMNPILLKPTSEVGSQVVLLGEPTQNNTAAVYHQQKKQLFSAACTALDRLRNRHAVVVLEGAGSCAEVNLMPHDIVNFSMAEYADAPVILVADIHRGGVFAQIVGTLECLAPDLRDRIAGFIINRFRGDIALFGDGVEWIEHKTGKPVLGVLPWFNHFRIEEEDSVVIEKPPAAIPAGGDLPMIAMIRIPHISNFTDFHPLQDLEGLSLHFVEKPLDLSPFRAVILPGSKNTRFDLNWLQETGWAEKLREYHAHKGHITGICGGYQMMGQTIHDPNGLEGAPGSSPGLNLLPVETTLMAPKTTTRTEFTWGNVTGTGYEIHMGQTIRHGGQPAFQVHRQNHAACHLEDGCMDEEESLIGTYIHGLFDTPEITRKWLSTIGLEHIRVSAAAGPAAREQAYALLSRHFQKHIQTSRILELLN